jgi:hypothetical protein
MSSPTPPAPSFDFEVSCDCNNCGETVYEFTAHSEQEFKEASAKALTASELHDCKGSAKGP